MNRLIILNEQYYSYSSHYSIAKNNVGEKGAGREKTRVGNTKSEKAGEIEGGMQPKNTMLNISKYILHNREETGNSRKGRKVILDSAVTPYNGRGL